MNAGDLHQTEALGAYVLGALDDQETAEVREHLAQCAECRTELDMVSAIRETLNEVPPEAFLDGPPDGGDLLLQRTLREMRRERNTSKRGRWVVGSAAAAVAVALALGGGVLLGQNGNANQNTASPGPTVAPPATGATAVPGTTVVSGTSADARLTATITPAAGWVRVNASVMGIPAGQRCELIVVSRSGDRQVAGSWLVSTKLAANGVNLDGSALVAPDQIAAIEVQNVEGHTFVVANA
jgi:anti-sigma factor RsiW